MRLDDFSKVRLAELLTEAISGLMEEDEYSAIEYMHDTMDMTMEECEYFGVDVEYYKNDFKWERTCPVCGVRYSEYPVLSRRDNETEICSKCGLNESMEDLMKQD